MPSGEEEYNEEDIQGRWSTGWGQREILPGETLEQATERWKQEDRDSGKGSGQIYGSYDLDGNTSGGGRLSNGEEIVADIPVIGWLGGYGARRDAARAENAAEMNRNVWSMLADTAPTANDLWVQYENEDSIDGPASAEMANARADAGSIQAQQDALRAMQNVYQSGGMTPADHARQQLARQSTGQAMRANREADLAQLEARGMAGSGAQLQSMLASQQMGAQSLAGQDAQMLIDAQQRAFQAMQSSAGLGSSMRDQSFGEDSTRRGSIDEFNRWQTDYQRGREGRNTDRNNQTRESRSTSRQQAYDNRERQAAGITNQYSTDVARRGAEAARSDATNQAAAGTIGTIISAAL